MSYRRNPYTGELERVSRSGSRPFLSSSSSSSSSSPHGMYQGVSARGGTPLSSATLRSMASGLYGHHHAPHSLYTPRSGRPRMDKPPVQRTYGDPLRRASGFEDLIEKMPGVRGPPALKPVITRYSIERELESKRRREELSYRAASRVVGMFDDDTDREHEASERLARTIAHNPFEKKRLTVNINGLFGEYIDYFYNKYRYPEVRDLVRSIANSRSERVSSMLRAIGDPEADVRVVGKDGDTVSIDVKNASKRLPAPVRDEVENTWTLDIKYNRFPSFPSAL